MSPALRAIASLGAPLLISGDPALRGAPPARQLSHFPASPHFSDILANCPHEPLVVHLRTEAYSREVSWELVAETGHHIENYADHSNYHHEEGQNGDEVPRESVPQIGHHFESHAGQPAPQIGHYSANDVNYDYTYYYDEGMCEGVGEADHSHHHTACCLPAGNYRLVCSSSHGYGWHGGFLTINGVEFCGGHADNGDHNGLHHGHHVEVALLIGERTSTETTTTTITQTSTTPHTTTDTTATATTTTPHTTTATDTETSTTSLHTTTATTASTTHACQDEPGWFDAGGPEFDCAWYASPEQQQPGDRCGSDGHLLARDGKTANQACCVCRELLGPTPAPTEPPQDCAVHAVHVQVNDFSPNFAWEIVPAFAGGPNEERWDITRWNDESLAIPSPVCSGPAGSHSRRHEGLAPRSCCLPPGEYAFRCQSNSPHHGLNGESVMANGAELCGAWGGRERAVELQVEPSGIVHLIGLPIVPDEPGHCRPHEVHVGVRDNALKFDWQIVPYGGPNLEHWDIHDWGDASPSMPRPVCSRPKGTYEDHHWAPAATCCLTPGEYAIRCRNSAGLQGETVSFNGQQLCGEWGPTESAALFHVPY